VRSFRKDKLDIRIYENRNDMGKAAAAGVAADMRRAMEDKGSVTMVFAAAPSQDEFLDALCSYDDLDWSRVTAFHLDEYTGLPEEAPQRFGNYLRRHIFDRVHPGKVHYLDGNADPIEKECDRYASLLEQHPVDIACIGIGENGHIAFNDPPVADFNDPKTVKVVQLDAKCRQQQVNDGCFATIDQVPAHALTLTVPAIMAARAIHCVVPGPTKVEAVKATVEGEISTKCPASILRRHAAATLYIDRDAALLLNL